MTDIVTEKVVEAPVERIWSAWTDPEELAQWWWPMFPDTAYDLDVRVGGSFRIETPAGGIGARGGYVEVVPDDRLAMTWTWLTYGTDDGPEDVVTVTFSASGGAVVVRVAHRTVAAEPGGYAQGWSDCLDRLADYCG